MNVADIITALGVSGVILHFAAQLITIFTPTPNPATVIGKIYKVIESLAGLVGQAKDQFTSSSPRA